MRKITFLLCLFVCLCACQRHTNTSLYKFNLRGEVKSLTHTAYRAEIQNGKTEKTVCTDEYFNNGLIYQRVKMHQEFNEDGFILLKRQHNHLGKVLSRDLYIWNGDRRILRITFDSIGHPCQKVVFGENEAGKEDGYEMFDANGERISCARFFYNEKGLICEEKYYDADERMTSRNMTYYNNDHTVARIEYIDLNRQAIYEAEYTRHILSRSTFSYTQGLGLRVRTTEYDRYGNPIRRYVNDGTDEDYTYQYSYDKHHNWTERITFDKGEPVWIETREIVYYE